MTVDQDTEKVLARCKELSQRVLTFVNRTVGESDALAVEVKSLEAELSRLEGALAAEGGPSGRRSDALNRIHQSRGVISGMGPGGDLRRLCQPPTPFLLRFLLGRCTQVVTLRKDQSIAMKEEYHTFRNQATMIMVVIPLAIYLGFWRADALKENRERYTLTPPLMTVMQAYLAWLSYFYLALALRESVLLVNGSNIRPWWIQHHMLAAACSLMMLALPVSSPTVYYFCEHFLLWSSFQAMVMMVQNRYQRRRMYTRIALGKNSAMDVVGGESSGEQGQLMLLYPLLFVLQAWQAVLGVRIAYNTFPALLNKEGWLDMEHSDSDLRGMRGTFFTASVFAILAVMNFYHTLATMRQKRHHIFTQPGKKTEKKVK